MKANYHTHTARCNHAKGTEREYVEAAIENGFQILGFSDHTPYGFDENYSRGMRMDIGEMEAYIDTIHTLRDEYKKDIDIYVGLEMEYYPLFFDDLCEKLRPYPLDYLILSAHHFGNSKKGERHFFYPTDDGVYLREYFYQLTTGMNQGIFSYVAHPDLLNYTGEMDEWESYMRKICQIANKNKLPLEINFHGILTNRNYPNDAFWKIAGEEGCKVIFGIDAHLASEFDYKPQYDRAMEIAKKYNLQLLEELSLKKPFR